ncbi:MAG: endolytic transglycosylase MltG [Terriglobia bacterium]
MRWRLLLLVVGAAAVGLLWLAFDLLSPYRGYAGNVLLVIEPGSRASQVAELLVARGVLRHRLPFLVRYWAGRHRHALRAGEYLFDRPLRPIDVCRRLIQGDVYLHPVLIPEGSDRFDMARILNLRLGIDPVQFLRVTQQGVAIRDLDPTAPSLEGYLFPDTYRFPRGVSAATVVLTMLARFRHILAARLANQGPSSPAGWHEVITLASLVEKETPEPTERPLIAGVFARRLESGIPLQSDPTVVYAARLDQRPAGPITQSDLAFDSPYNTYRHSGLPPGPIANPGLASIRAALHPADGDALYFVANNHGGHVFARTLAEHQLNVSRYRREVAALRRNEPGTAGRNSKPPAHEASQNAAQAQKRARNAQ